MRVQVRLLYLYELLEMLVQFILAIAQQLLLVK